MDLDQPDMLVIIDTETTCLAQRHVVEIACHVIDGDKTFSYTERLNPGWPIDPKASAVHGIYDSDIEDCRSSVEAVRELWDEIKDREDMILAGHNVSFDIKALRRYIDIPNSIPILDTLTLARRRWPDFVNHKLGTVHRSLGMNTGKYNLHEAMSDVLIVRDIIQHICDKEGVTYQELAIEQKAPKALKVMPFGKFKGVAFRDIDISYLRYMTSLLDLDGDVRKAMQDEIEKRR